MKLKIKLSLWTAIDFDGFDPGDVANGLSLSLAEGKYLVTLYTYDPPSNIPETRSTKSGFVFDVELPDQSFEVIEALRSHQPTESLEHFYHEIYDLIANVYGPIQSYARNIARQYWLEPIFNERKVLYGAYLGSYCGSSVWLDSDGTWKALFQEPEIKWDEYTDEAGVVHRTGVGTTKLIDDSDSSISNIHNKAKPINAEMWSGLLSTIQEGKQAPMRDVLIANSLNHLEMGDGRLAIVEAVIALEASIKHLVPRLLRHVPGAKEINFEYLDNLIENMGLRGFTKLGLGTIKGLIGLDDTDIQAILEAVDVRNLIIHNARREVSLRDAQRYVYAIEHVISTFELGFLKDQKV